MNKKLSIVGNIKIQNKKRLVFLLSSIRSLKFACNIVDKFYLNIENFDLINTNIQKQISETLSCFNYILTNNNKKYYDEIYCDFLNKVSTKYFMHFEEDHFCVMDNVCFLSNLLKLDFDLCPITFFQLLQKRNSILPPIKETECGNIYYMNHKCFELSRNQYKQFYIGNNAIFNTYFGKKYWSRYLETKKKCKKPHALEIKNFNAEFIHTKIVPNKEILCSIDDSHKVSGSNLLQRNNEKFDYIYMNTKINNDTIFKNKYKYTRNMTYRNKKYKFYEFSTKDIIDNFLNIYVDKPVHFLEIGCYEGLTSVLFLDNILTHKDSKLTCIEPFNDTRLNRNNRSQQYEYFIENINIANASNKTILITEYSSTALKKMRNNRYDFIYIDANHETYHPLEDCVLSFPLLKLNGIMCIDDYLAKRKKYVKEAIDCFLNTYREYLEILFNGNKILIKKTQDIND